MMRAKVFGITMKGRSLSTTRWTCCIIFIGLSAVACGALDNLKQRLQAKEEVVLKPQLKGWVASSFGAANELSGWHLALIEKQRGFGLLTTIKSDGTFAFPRG